MYCPGCGKEIPPINLEFGSVYYSIDSNPYCSRECSTRYSNFVLAEAREIELLREMNRWQGKSDAHIKGVVTEESIGTT